MSEGRCGSGENALRQRMESRSDQGSLGIARGRLLDLFGSLRLPHGAQDDKAISSLRRGKNAIVVLRKSDTVHVVRSWTCCVLKVLCNPRATPWNHANVLVPVPSKPL